MTNTRILKDGDDAEPIDLTRLRHRDHASFTALVREHHGAMLSLAQSIVGDWADEVVQDAWLSIYRKLPGFEGRSSLRTWIFTVVRNQALTRLRKEKRVTSLDTAGENRADDDGPFTPDGRWQHPPETWPLDTPEALLEETELRNCLNRALENLSADQRAVFTLRDLQQLDADEICNILDISASNQRVLLHRARAHMMKTINRYQKTGQC